MTEFNPQEVIAEHNDFGNVKTYEVHDIHDFDNAMDEIASLDEADKAVRDRYEKQTAPWKAFMEAELAKNEQRRQFLSREVLGFVLDHNDGHTLKSARGSVKVRQVSASAKIVDQAAAVSYAKANGLQDVVKVAETVDAKKLKEATGLMITAGGKVIDKDGQQIDGYEVTPAHTSVKIDSEGMK
ncbi:host-nuclease inhibitor Gam family protein [Lacticaseibacillus absianus]|uniref:host-nuclease inhibitor Gam family protein n=1 Tax=Lacticaseibacillus absianus TaxID=2729623 RepID=UPI0015CA5106|nr:host-nuclease inhibitor Gam family protein [Lacticaseibacillus absianus]